MTMLHEEPPASKPSLASPSQGARLTLGRAIGLVVLLALIAGLVVVAAPQFWRLAPSVGNIPTNPPTWTLGPTQTPAPFAAFSDWRAVYLRADGRLHAAALDGVGDALGPALDQAKSAQVGQIGGGAISPDGRSLAFIAGDQFVIGPLGLGSLVSGGFHTFARRFTQAVWSPDSARLAVVEGGALKLLRADDLSVTPVVWDANPILLGWIDREHVALLLYDNRTGATIVVVASVVDGSERTIFTVQRNWTNARFTLSPDGASLLYSAAPWRDEQFTPFVEVIATADGRVRHLPNSSARLTLGVNSLAWKPGTALVAVTAQRSPASGENALYLLDVAHDTVTPIDTTLPYVLGWAPDGSRLLMSAWEPSTAAYLSARTMVALTVNVATGRATEVTLSDAVAGAFFGFARTA